MNKRKEAVEKISWISGCVLLLLVAALFLASCGKKEIKPVSQEAKLAQEAFALAETLKNSYLRNNLGSLEENSTKEGYRELIRAIKAFDSAELTFTPTWVEIGDSVVYLTVSWKGIWTVRGKSTEERGLAIFVLEGRPLKLAQVQRSNPFRQPE